MTIQMKTLSLFDDLKREPGSSAVSERFMTSHEWLKLCKSRSRLHSVMISDESASSNKEAVTAYPALLKKKKLLKKGTHHSKS